MEPIMAVFDTAWDGRTGTGVFFNYLLKVVFNPYAIC